MVFDLMFSLGATEDQLDFPVVYGSAKQGWMGADYNQPTDDISYLLNKIIEVIPAPKHIIIDKDENGDYVTKLFAKEQSHKSMLKILGY